MSQNPLQVSRWRSSILLKAVDRGKENKCDAEPGSSAVLVLEGRER